MRRYRDLDYVLGTPEERAHEDALCSLLGLREAARDYLDCLEARRQTPFLYMFRRWQLGAELLCSFTPSTSRIHRPMSDVALVLIIIAWLAYILAAHIIALALACPFPRTPLEDAVSWRMDRLTARLVDLGARLEDEE